MQNIRIGQGYDVHALTYGDGLVLGGVQVPANQAFVAHSDGDVLIHALCDALLGALGRGDIGGLFPNTDPANQDRDSREFLRQIKILLDTDGYQLGNADVTIVAQAPNMASYIPTMKQNLSADLDLQPQQVNIKATTTEKLGFVGRQEGISVYAVVLLEKRR